MELTEATAKQLFDRLDNIETKIDRIKSEITPVRKINYHSNEVCEILGINKITFYRWIEKGFINAVKKGKEWYLSQIELDRINKPDFIRSRNKSSFQ